MSKSAAEQIEALRERRDQLNARIQRIQAKENAKARKARTHRLIQNGAVLETVMGMELDTDEIREDWMREMRRVVAVYDPAHGGNINKSIVDLVREGLAGAAAPARGGGRRRGNAAAAQPADTGTAHRAAAELHAQPPTHRTPGRSAADGQVVLTGPVRLAEPVERPPETVGLPQCQTGSLGAVHAVGRLD